MTSAVDIGIGGGGTSVRLKHRSSRIRQYAENPPAGARVWCVRRARSMLIKADPTGSVAYATGHPTCCT
jgi:hypothetical protein